MLIIFTELFKITSEKIIIENNKLIKMPVIVIILTPLNPKNLPKIKLNILIIKGPNIILKYNYKK
jgi:hypothetical protein